MEQAWVAANKGKVLEQPPCSPDVAPADYFLFQRAGWHPVDAGDPQEDLGWGHENH